MLVLGHRGASASHPENSLVAFAAALAAGADGIELDVRRTADGGLAVRHDPTLADGRSILDLRTADLPAAVPVLADVYDATVHARVVNTEIKNLPDDADFDPDEHLARAVVDLLTVRGELADPRHLISSFHLPTIDLVHQLAPALATAWLVIDAGPATVEKAASHGHVALHPHHAFVNEELVTAAHAAGLAINTWTVDDPDRVRWLESLGVDGVVCNDPGAALAALGR
jgi:glycerophosphoryl diester phosphodiesterase